MGRSCPVRGAGPRHPICCWTVPQVKSSRQWWACPSHWKPAEQLPQLLWGLSGCQGSRPAPGSRIDLLRPRSGHDCRPPLFGWAGPALLPCLQVTRVLDLRLGRSSQTLSRLSPSPRGSPGAGMQPCRFLAVRVGQIGAWPDLPGLVLVSCQHVGPWSRPSCARLASQSLCPGWEGGSLE